MNLTQRVQLDNGAADEKQPTGTVIGLGHVIRNGETRPIYIVELDQGFYDPSQSIFVSCLVVARDNLKPID